MKTALSIAVTTLLFASATAFAAPDEATMMAREKAAWEAFKDKKADEFKKVVDKDMVGVYSDGISSVSKEVADMQKWDMKSFAISNYKIFSDEKDVTVSTYVVTLKGTYNGQDASGAYNAGTVWKMENGQWLAIFHTNVKAENAAK